MKKTRLVALVALVAVCIAGWTVLGMNAVSEVKTQKDTVAAAEYYRGKKLFQLSLQNYMSAIGNKPTEALYDAYIATCKEYMRTVPRRMSAASKKMPMRRLWQSIRLGQTTGRLMCSSIMRTATTTRW